MAKDRLRISVDGGKYTIVQPNAGRTYVLRYGCMWRDVTGDSLILALAYELEEARAERDNAIANVKRAAEGVNQL